MAKRRILKKTLLIALGIVVVVQFLSWVHFITLPYLLSKRIGAEIVSSTLFWPTRWDENINIPWINGRALVFDQGAGKKNLLRVVEADGRIYDIQLPEGKRGLYGSFRDVKSPPLVVIWDGLADLWELGKYVPKDSLEFKFVEIQKNGEMKIETLLSKDILLILDISDDWFSGEVAKEGEREKAFISRLGIRPLQDADNIILPQEGDNIIVEASIFGGKVVYIHLYYDRKYPHPIYAYSITDKTVKIIAEEIDMKMVPRAWAYNGHILAWAARRDKSVDPNDRHRLIGPYDIFYYDFQQNKSGVLISDEGNQLFPFLHQHYLFWADGRNSSKTGYDIYVKNLHTGVVKVLVEGPMHDNYPVYFNGYLYWTMQIESALTTLCGLPWQQYVFRKKIDLP